MTTKQQDSEVRDPVEVSILSSSHTPIPQSFACYNPCTDRFEKHIDLRHIFPLSSDHNLPLNRDFSWRVRQKLDLLGILNAFQNDEFEPVELDQNENYRFERKSSEDKLQATYQLLGISEPVTSFFSKSRPSFSDNFAWPTLHRASPSSVRLRERQRGLVSFDSSKEPDNSLISGIRSYRFAPLYYSTSAMTNLDDDWISCDQVLPAVKYLDHHFRNPHPTVQRIYPQLQYRLRRELSLSHQQNISSLLSPEAANQLLATIKPFSLRNIFSSTSSTTDTDGMNSLEESLQRMIAEKTMSNMMCRHIEAVIDAIVEMILNALQPYITIASQQATTSRADEMENEEGEDDISLFGSTVENSSSTGKRKSKKRAREEGSMISSGNTSVVSIRSLKRAKLCPEELLSWESILFLLQTVATELIERNIQFLQVHEKLPVIFLTPLLMQRVTQRIQQTCNSTISVSPSG